MITVHLCRSGIQMTKREMYVNQISPIASNRKKLESFLVTHSNLPGPRANLELLFALSATYEDHQVLTEWLAIAESQEDGTTPRSFLPMCAAACLGKLYVKRNDRRIIEQLRCTANDNRWRVREGVAFGLQFIGEDNFNALKEIVNLWLYSSSNREKRAILAGLAHPPILDNDAAAFCLATTDQILHTMDRTSDFEILRKGLDYAISVFATASPEAGFRFIEQRIGDDTVLNRIMRENLRKNRLMKINPSEVRRLLDLIR